MLVYMMVFSDDDQTPTSVVKRRRPKRHVVVGAFLLVLVASWLIMQPHSKKPTILGGGNSSNSSNSSDDPDGAANISGTVSGQNGQAVTNAEIRVTDSTGTAINDVAVNQKGHFELFLPNGTYNFSVNAGDQQLVKQVKVGPDEPKELEFQMNLNGNGAAL